MNSFQRAFFKGAKAGRRTAAQDMAMREKQAAAMAKRAAASQKRRETNYALKQKAIIESEKTRREEIKFFRRS